MANQLKSNPWLIDTTSASPIFKHPLHNCQFEYVGYTDSTHVAEIQDQNGNIIALLQGVAGFALQRSGKVGWVEGLLVPVNKTGGGTNLSSGKIIAYFE